MGGRTRARACVAGSLIFSEMKPATSFTLTSLMSLSVDMRRALLRAAVVAKSFEFRKTFPSIAMSCFTYFSYLRIQRVTEPFFPPCVDLTLLQSLRTSTHPMLTLLALACTQVDGFFSQPNLCPSGSRFYETY